MKRRYLIWLAIAVIIVAGLIVWLVIRSSQNTGKTNQPSPSGSVMSYQDRLSALQQLFVKQSGQPKEKVNISIARENNQFIKGIVTIADDYEGIFLAAKVNNDWKIIWDGKKKYECSDIAQYQLPTEISGCK